MLVKLGGFFKKKREVSRDDGTLIDTRIHCGGICGVGVCGIIFSLWSWRSAESGSGRDWFVHQDVMGSTLALSNQSDISLIRKRTRFFSRQEQHRALAVTGKNVPPFL